MVKGKAKSKDSKEKGGEKPEKKRAKHVPTTGVTGREIRGIIRLAGKDLKGEVPLTRALTKVNGVGVHTSKLFSSIAIKELKLPPEIVVGELNDEELSKVEYVLSNPAEYGVPTFLLNHQKDVQTGLDKHLVSTDLAFTVRQEVEREKEINSWKGYRHRYGQRVRGQRTRTTGRKGLAVGVMRKKILAKTGGKSEKKDK